MHGLGPVRFGTFDPLLAHLESFLCVFFRQMYLLARRPETDPFLPHGLFHHPLGNQIRKSRIFNDVCPFHPLLAVSLLEKSATRGFEFYGVLPPQYLFTAALLLTALEMRVAVNVPVHIGLMDCHFATLSPFLIDLANGIHGTGAFFHTTRTTIFWSASEI